MEVPEYQTETNGEHHSLPSLEKKFPEDANKTESSTSEIRRERRTSDIRSKEKSTSGFCLTYSWEKTFRRATTALQLDFIKK